MPDPADHPPSSGAPDAPTDSLAEQLAESVIHEFDRELRHEKSMRRRLMAKKHVWGVQPLWVLGVGLVLTAGLLLRGDDRWIALVAGGLILAIDVGLWRPADAKRGLVEVILSGAVAVTAIASRAALTAAGREAADLDLILVSTTSPDMGFASTACQVQRELKAPKCAALDLAASCTGFLYGLAIAQAFLRTGQARTVLLAAGEVKSRFIDQDDPSSAILF